MLNIYEQVDANKRKSILIMVLFVLFIAAVSWVLARALGYGLGFMGWALILSGLMSLASYYWSDKIILTLSPSAGFVHLPSSARGGLRWARKLQAIQDYKKSLLTQFFDKSVLSEVEGLRAGKKNSKNCSNNP